MAFEVAFSQLAADRFRKLDARLRHRIVAKLEVVANNPHRYLSRLTAVESYNLRVGDYRLIIDLDTANRRLNVVTLGHRSTIYR